MKVILIIIVLILFFAIVVSIFEFFMRVLKWIAIIIGIILCIALWKISVPIIVAFITITIISAILIVILDDLKKKRIQKTNRAWLKNNETFYTTEQIDQIILPFIEYIYETDGNKLDYKFGINSIPYGRANAFLNYFGKTIDTDEPYYYSCIPSLIESEFREYGLLITREGIYVSNQYKDEKNNTYGVRNYVFEFPGLQHVSIFDNHIKGYYVNSTTYDNQIRDLFLPEKSVSIHAIQKLCEAIINSRISVAFILDRVADYTYVASRANLEEENFYKKNNEAITERIVETASVGSSSVNYTAMYQETKGYLNSSQGGGYAAEYANNTFDRLKGMKVESTAQVLDEHGRQVKAGADRTVNGIEIQTKYYKTAYESVVAAFEEGRATYIRSDGSGRMMQIEVPRDQYNEALQIMQKKIDNGQVPNIKSGESASDYVRKGYYTYSQVWNVCKSGTVESLTVDAATGAICTSCAAGISAVLVFAKAIWNGESIENAVQYSLATGIRILGKGTLIYIATMQLSRKEIANPFVKEYLAGGTFKGFSGVANPIYELSENLALNIKNSSVAQGKLGEAFGLKKLSGKSIISGSVTAAVVFGPDLCKTLSGKISLEQMVKNSAISVSGMVGAGIGQTLIPIPIIGGMIGGSIGGFLSKNLLDNFIEDDAKKMFRILKEEFINEVMMAELTHKEVETVRNNTVGHKDLSNILQDMYASGDSREYARVAIVDAAIVITLRMRRQITQDFYNEGIETILCQTS